MMAMTTYNLSEVTSSFTGRLRFEKRLGVAAGGGFHTVRILQQERLVVMAGGAAYHEWIDVPEVEA